MKCRNCSKEFKPVGSGNWMFCSHKCRRTFNSVRLKTIRSLAKCDQHINLALTKDQMIFVVEQATRLGVSRSQYVRHIIDTALEVEYDIGGSE